MRSPSNRLTRPPDPGLSSFSDQVLKMTTPAGMGKRGVKDPTRVKAVAGGRALTRKNEAAF